MRTRTIPAGGAAAGPTLNRVIGEPRPDGEFAVVGTAGRAAGRS